MGYDIVRDLIDDKKFSVSEVAAMARLTPLEIKELTGEIDKLKPRVCTTIEEY